MKKMLKKHAKNARYESDPLFHTKDIAKMWDAVQRCQVDFAVNQELAAYYTSSEWEKSRTVLDIGTGNGYYLAKLASFFSEKAYHGVDTSQELIAIAEKNYSTSGIRFSCMNLFDVTNSYDFVIMRLLLQHLKDSEAALNQVAKITQPGGSAFIIDAYDSARLFKPDVPEFWRFFNAYSEQQAQLGLDRNVAAKLLPKIKNHPSWKVGSTVQVLLPSTIPGNLEIYRRYYDLMIQIVEKADQLKYDFEEVKVEWNRWCGLERAYTQVGLNMIRIDRV